MRYTSPYDRETTIAYILSARRLPNLQNAFSLNHRHHSLLYF